MDQHSYLDQEFLENERELELTGTQASEHA